MTDPTTLRSTPARAARLWARAHDEAGEGVISTAIAVLIMALIGAAMWIAFDGVFRDARDRIEDSVQEIG